MTTIRRFSSDNPRISAQVMDTTNNNLWVAYEADENGVCVIEKLSVFSPDQVFFRIERELTGIVALQIQGTSLYAAYNDSVLLNEKFSITNPLTTSSDVDLPGSVNESPIDLTSDSGNLYFLLPGSASGENAKVLIYDLNGNLEEIVDLIRSGESVIDATSITIDDEGDLWICTYTDPATIVRVYQESGGDWTFSITEIV